MMREQKECMEFINSLKYGMGEECICKLRTKYCVEWYTRKAIKYKLFFIVLSVINIAIPQISTLVVMVTQCSVCSAFFSAIVSVSASLLALLNVKDRWTRYRAGAEYIKKEYTFYCARKPPYEGDNAHIAYLSVLEEYMSEEQRNWIDMQRDTARSEDK